MVLSAAVAIPPVWLGSYFLFSSSAGPPLFAAMAPGRPPLTFDRMQWGPDPSHFTVIAPRFTNFEGRQTIMADAAWFELRALSLDTIVLLGAKVLSDTGHVGIGAERLHAEVDRTAFALAAVRLSRLHARDFVLDLRWDADGTFNLSKSFASTRPGVKKPRPDPTVDGPPRLPWLQVDGIVLTHGDLRFQWPTGSFSVLDATARGSYGSQPWAGLDIDADLQGAETTLALPMLLGPTPRRWRTIEISRYLMRGRTTDVELLALEGKRDGHVRLWGARFGPQGSRGRLEVAAAEASVGPYSATDAWARLRFDLSAGVLGLSGNVSLDAAHAATLDGPHDLRVGRPQLRAMDLTLAPTSASLTVGDFDVERLASAWMPAAVDHSNFSGSANVSLTGGSLDGQFRSMEHGDVKASGDIDVSLWRQRATITVRLALADVRAALADALEVQAPSNETLVYEAQAPLSELVSGRWRPAFARLDKAPRR